MIRVQYCSDLHLEFQENADFLEEYPLKPSGEVLLLAGDIVTFNSIERHSAFFDFVSDNFEVTYWIPGNHEYYHFDLAGRSGPLNEKIRSNVFLVNNQAVKYKNVRFIFSTLWTSISQARRAVIEHGMNDFHVIKLNGKRFTADDYNELHRESKDFLINALTSAEQEVDATIGVTHHVPTFKNYPEQYRGDALNEAFAVELSDMIENSNVDLWIYGHHHQPIPEFKIGKTRLVTNQLGYVRYNEHKGFDKGKVLVV